VDLRKGSPTYGEWDSFDLNAEKPSAVLVPKGLAHGFYVEADNTLIHCKSSGVFNGPSDKAISCKGFSFHKDLGNPILSDKDLAAPSFSEFDSPFNFNQ
jgi:dTDP-4-dehydrorhamnose 3,5-epimerase